MLSGAKARAIFFLPLCYSKLQEKGEVSCAACHTKSPYERGFEIIIGLSETTIDCTIRKYCELSSDNCCVLFLGYSYRTGQRF